MTMNGKMLTVGVALAASLAAASPASAALIIAKRGHWGPVFPGRSGRHDPEAHSLRIPIPTTSPSPCPAASSSVETQMQASRGFPRLIQYSIWEGPPGSGAFIDQSALGIGPTVTQTLSPGNYYLQIDNIAQNGELVSGGLVVSAIPEPMAWTLMLVGSAGVGAALRRRMAKSAAIAA